VIRVQLAGVAGVRSITFGNEPKFVGISALGTVSPQQTGTRYVPILILILWESEGNAPFVDKAATGGNGVSLSREGGAVEILTTLRLLGVVKTHGVHAGVELVHLVDEHDLRK
jgi:hypothetical protein